MQSRRVPARTHTACMMKLGDDVSRRSLLQVTAAGAFSTLFFGAPALADHTYVAAKRAYERYYPRIVAGVEQTRTIGTLVGTASDNAAIAEIVDGKLFDIKFRRALSIYATSFSDNYLGERSRDLLKCVDAFYTEIGKVKAAGTAEEGKDHYNRAVNAMKNYFEIARLDKSSLKGLDV